MTFRESLADLKNKVGRRNAMLMSVAIRGIGEGLSPEEVATAFAETDCGDPPLTDQEVSRAISRAKEYHTGEANTNERRFAVAMKRMKAIREGTSPDERSFVRRMIRIGDDAIRNRTDKNEPGRILMSISPVRVIGIGSETRTDVRRYMASAFLKAVYGGVGGEKVFATDNIKAPRDASRVYTVDALNRWLSSDDEPFKNNVLHFSPLEYIPGHESHRVPTHICANMVTGESVTTRKGGPSSYANKNTIATYSNALIEFDMMPLNDQAKFWYGVIQSGEFDVRSIVYSGNKSLHGIVRVDEMTFGDDLFGNVTEDAKRQKWSREWEKLIRICCSDDDYAYRCDAACKDPTRMTRFPGGLRDHVTEQLLVYCK